MARDNGGLSCGSQGYRVVFVLRGTSMWSMSSSRSGYVRVFDAISDKDCGSHAAFWASAAYRHDKP